MKIFLTLILCVLVVDYSLCLNKRTVKLPPEAASALIFAVQQCMAENGGVPVEALLLVVQGGYREDKNFKDFVYCSYKKAGYLKPDGRINTEKSKKLFKNDSDVIEGVTRCGESTGESSKEAVFNYFKCFQDTVPVQFTL